jgi:uncharacterized RDD family membrane protein YckC
MELQKASFWKRISAWLFDSILLMTFAVLFGFALSGMLGFDSYNNSLDQAYAKYETQYDIKFDISQEDYEKLSQQKKDDYNAAYEALLKDEEAIIAYNMVVNLTMVITSLGVLLSVAGLEFVVPLLFKNGQTIGRKIFGVALVKPDGVKMNNMQLFVRTLLGKYTVGTMVPVLVFIMLMFNITGFLGTLLVFGIWTAQLLCLLCTQNKVGLADLMAGTVPVELNSQRIFETTEDLIAYQKKLHAEEAARQEY